MQTAYAPSATRTRLTTIIPVVHCNAWAAMRPRTSRQAAAEPARTATQTRRKTWRLIGRMPRASIRHVTFAIQATIRTGLSRRNATAWTATRQHGNQLTRQDRRCAWIAIFIRICHWEPVEIVRIATQPRRRILLRSGPMRPASMPNADSAISGITAASRSRQRVSVRTATPTNQTLHMAEACLPAWTATLCRTFPTPA